VILFYTVVIFESWKIIILNTYLILIIKLNVLEYFVVVVIIY